VAAPYHEDMDKQPADPAKLLEAWMEWERGEAMPGRVMATFKTGGLRDLLEGLVAVPEPDEGTTGAVAAAGAEKTAVPGESPAADAEVWTPVV
jgi:hypothetical protein